MLLLLSRFSRVRLWTTPKTAAHQAPPSLGFSRQEQWSGLPFLSPMLLKWKVKVKLLSHVRLLVTKWTATYQAPPSMGFSRQEYWSRLPFPSLADTKWYAVKWRDELGHRASWKGRKQNQEVESQSRRHQFLKPLSQGRRWIETLSIPPPSTPAPVPTLGKSRPSFDFSFSHWLLS